MSLDALRAAADRYRKSAAEHEKDRAELYSQIRAALAEGLSKAEVARAAGLSREMIYVVNRGDAEPT